MKGILKSVVWIFKRMSAKQIASLVLVTTLGVLLSLGSVGLSVALKQLIDTAQKGGLNIIWLPAAFFASLLLFQMGVNYIHTVQQSKLAASVSNRIREEIFGDLTKSDWQSFCGFHSDDIMTRLTSDIDLIADGVAGTLPNMVSLGVNILAAMAVLLSYEPMLAVFAFILGPSGVLFSRIWGRKIKKYHLKLQESESASREFLHENLQNMLIVKTFGLEQINLFRFKKIQDKKYYYTIRQTVLGAFANIVLSISYGAGYCLALCWGAYKIAVSRGAFSFGTFSAFLQLVGQIQGPFSSLAASIPQLIQAYASTERLLQIDGMPPEDYNAPPCAEGPVGVRFRDVSFAYDESNVILSHAFCEIPPNQITAVVGLSGEGKTTMIKLMLALYRPESGSILFTRGGIETSAGTATRNYISYVPQGNTLFSGTIRENLLCGRGDASEEELTATLKAVSAWTFVERLPEKLDSKIGEHGLGLSEGQAQRLSIARALLRKTPVLILDEATSALDVDTEIQVLQAVKNSLRTCIVITHRLSALGICGSVLRIQNGVFTESVPPQKQRKMGESLLAREGLL